MNIDSLHVHTGTVARVEMQKSAHTQIYIKQYKCEFMCCSLCLYKVYLLYPANTNGHCIMNHYSIAVHWLTFLFSL